MKTIIKLIVVALVLNAAFHVGTAYWQHYQFEDEVKEAAQFVGRSKADELTARVYELADKYEIPLDADAVKVTKAQRRVTVEAAYSREIEVAPSYPRHWDFAIHVSVLTLN
jgi:predicted negative regulator of RcsB-dependent stress response